MPRSNGLSSRSLRLLLTGGCLLLAAAAAACGGNGQEAPSSTASPAPVPTVAPVPTIDPNVPLVEYSSPELGYSVSYPEGWTSNASSGSLLATFSLTLAGRPIAQLTVLCSKGANQTVESLVMQDRVILGRYGAAMPTETTDVELGGVSGKQVAYTVGLGGLTIEQVAAYAVKGDNGWRIGLATYGAGTLQSYLPLFQRIIASFRLD
jgi:hypothetical protein